jgi:hypothetical protein
MSEAKGFCGAGILPAIFSNLQHLQKTPARRRRHDGAEAIPIQHAREILISSARIANQLGTRTTVSDLTISTHRAGRFS